MPEAQHIIEKVVVLSEGQVIVHKEGCPACLAGIPPEDFTYEPKQGKN